ncbi:unnamed protein product [Orchesella dallaii]|uniref:Uncharacterized protein n=1 Tax=Orchesella dallaii TaxID=48710 RepID=A0ABP1RMQ9_9HEXA
MFLFSKPKALESEREHLTHDEAMTELVANVRGMVENQQHLHTQMNLLKDGQIKHDQKMKNLKLRLKDMTVKMQNSRAITLPPPNMQLESPVNSPIDSPYESDAEGQPATQKEDLENPMNAHIPEPSAPHAPAENTDALPPPKNAYPNGKQQGNRSSQQPQESSSQHANQGEKISPPETKQPPTDGNKPKSNAGHTHGNGKGKANARFCNFCKKPNHTEEACWKKEMLSLINIQQQASPSQMAQASTQVENGHGDRMMWSQFLPPHSSQK